MPESPTATQSRKAEHPVDELFVRRWSPRSFTGEEIPEQELMSLFEAAKWAPSSYNNQSWRAIYARRNTPAWNHLFGLLVAFNQSWCDKASALIVFISKKTFDHNGKPCRTHSFDTGSAWMSLALQAHMKGWVAHGMEGFDYDRAKSELGIPDDYQVEAMAAVGRQDDPEKLSPALRKNEKPSERRVLERSVFEGRFKV